MNDRSERLGELIHDMRNKLTIARANVEAFIDGKLAPSAERLGAVLQTLIQVDELMKDFRAASSAVDTHVQFQEIDVCALLAREYRSIEAVANAKRLSFEVRRCAVPSEACSHFVGDPVRIGQVVSNLLLNAVRYTPAGGSIAVDCGRHGGEIAIAISDSGPGVKTEEAERIFEPGYRGAAAKGTPGSGFGLSIVKEYVESHGGSVSVDSSSDQGATFTVRLPGTAECGPVTAVQCESCVAARRRPR